MAIFQKWFFLSNSRFVFIFAAQWETTLHTAMHLNLMQKYNRRSMNIDLVSSMVDYDGVKQYCKHPYTHTFIHITHTSQPLPKTSGVE
jgi:hypothetical protein